MDGSPRILILRGGAIGDFVLTLPALAALRQRWPDAYIELIGYPHVAELARIGGLVDRVDSLDRARIARLFAPRARLEPEMAAWLRAFHFAVSFLHDPDGVVRDNLLAAGVLQVLYTSPVGLREHAADHFMKPLESLAIYAGGPAVPALALTEEGGRFGLEWKTSRGAAAAPWVAHPGSGSPKKNWPLDRFFAVVEAARRRGREVAYLLGEADAPLRAPVAAHAETVGAGLIEGLRLVEAASVLAACAGYLGNDSGISHLASALGLPSLVLFGPSDARLWAPRGPRVRILEAPDGRMENLDVLPVAHAWLDGE